MKMSWDVLYFPEMSVPRHAWFSQFVLFFDSCGIIVPESHYDEDIDEVTRELISSKFVKRISPSAYYNWGNQADQVFSDHLTTIRRTSGYDHIHPGKIEFTPFFQRLKETGLAKKSKTGPYYEVARPHSQYVMTYLAVQLGIQPDLDMIPATGDNVAARLIANFPKPTLDSSLPENIGDILADALVAPVDVDFRDLLEFKEKHKNLLRDFRGHIEYLSELDARKRNTELSGLHEFCADLESKMRANRWAQFVKSDFAYIALGVAASVADKSYHGAAFGLLPIISRIIDERRARHEVGEMLRDPRAYAALAHKRFVGRTEPRL